MYNTTCIQDNQGRAQYADYTLNDIPGTATNYLKTLAYGNGDGVKYDYDNQGRVITETYKDNITSDSPPIDKTVSYGYDNSGYLASVTDSGSGITTKYFYDFAGRTSATEQKKNGSTLLKTALSYDGHGRLSRQDWTVGGASYYEQYTYDADDGKLTTMRSGTGKTLTMTYDGFGRLTGMTGNSTGRTYTYRDIEGTTNTTAQVESVSYNDMNSPLTYRYTYDSNGNIATISDPLQGARSYTYDSQNQLVEEKIGSATYTYSYDNAGNILTATNSTGSHTYTYGNEEWGDLLTAYDGQSITYDAIGNPTSYYNGTRWTFGWKNGRQLTTASNGTNSITYTYGADGLRTSKTVDGVLYTYYYEGGKLLKMTIGDTTTMDFFYDQYGRPFAVKHNTRMLYYVLNEQGDVTRLIHGNGDGYATYHYDAWGNITYSSNNQFARDNPLRYRGYVYDTETQLYYCQSRYYDPAIGRFINADALTSTGQGLLGNNMFAYCGNNPALYADYHGSSHHPTTFAVSGCGSSIRDVTEEVKSALLEAASRAKTLRYTANTAGDNRVFMETMIYREFYNLVNHEAPWDIKREQPWQETIQTTYPGYNVEVLFCGEVMTPEMLGNFTYGYLGYAYGIPLKVLKAGSYYAAGFPTGGPQLDNEIWDWSLISKGFAFAKSGQLEGA